MKCLDLIMGVISAAGVSGWLLVDVAGNTSDPQCGRTPPWQANHATINKTPQAI